MPIFLPMRIFRLHYIILFFSSATIFSQNDSVRWHFGTKISYSSILYPERKPVTFYRYSKSTGIGIFLEKTLKKNPKISLGCLLNFEILYLSESQPLLDTANSKYDPVTHTVVYQNFTDITLKYYNYEFALYANKKFGSRYTLGLGINGVYFNLKEKIGVNPVTYETGRTCTPNCRYYYSTFTYQFEEFGFLPFISIKNKFKLMNRHYLGLDLDIATLGFYRNYNSTRWEKNLIYSGISWDAINYISFNYIFYIR